MTTQKTTRPTISEIKEDIVGAGLHFLTGAGADLKQMVQQAVKNVVGDTYVSRKEYDVLARRVAALEGKKPAKTATKTAAKKSASKTKRKA